MARKIGNKDYKKLIKACGKLTEFRDYRMDDYISILFNTVLDFQLKTPTVVKADEYYTQNLWSKIRTHADLKRVLNAYPNTKKSNTLLANYLWNNNLWSRAKFLRELVAFFELKNVRGYKSLLRWIKTAKFEDVKGKIRINISANGPILHSIGPVLFEWWRLRLGKKTIKADVHVKKFVQQSLGYLPTSGEIISVLICISKKMRVKPRELDAAIWHYMSGY